MELKKGQNIIEHEAEIYSRPARTWFQTGKEKDASEGEQPVAFFLVPHLDLLLSFPISHQQTTV
jgi:ATP-dependent RNA helicase DDX27